MSPRFLRALSLLSPMLLGGLVAPLHAQSDKQDVIRVATQFFDGMRTRDTTLMWSTVERGTVLVIAGDPAKARSQPITMDDFIGRIGKGTGPGGDERMKDPEVKIDGSLASLWAYYTYTKGGETQINHCGIDAFLMRKGADGWKIFHLAGTIRTDGCAPIK